MGRRFLSYCEAIFKNTSFCSWQTFFLHMCKLCTFIFEQVKLKQVKCAPHVFVAVVIVEFFYLEVLLKKP